LPEYGISRIFAENSEYIFFKFQFYRKIDAGDAEARFLAHCQPSSIMLLELHAFKMLFYAESVGLVTSEHVTKMAVTPFHASGVAENSLLYASFTAVSSLEQELLQIEVLHCGNMEFRVLAKNNGTYKYFCSHPKRT